MVNKTVIRILVDKNLKITPQRIAVLEAIIGLDNHPSIDYLLQYLQLNFPHVAPGTVYKNLDLFVAKGIIKRVITDKDSVRYDAVLEKHHHLYCADIERIEDYYDDELNKIIDNYIKKKKIPNFKVKEIKLQIVGDFIDNKKSN
jgi:Fur family peroxide stress response transcriptional regulator